MGNLNKVTYTDHQTVITADNLNAIQDSVIQNTSYITCTTGASTAAKTAALTSFVLTTGSAVKVKFTNTNTAANPTLNINSTGAKAIMQYGTTVAGTTATESWDDGAIVEFVYDGTNWVMQGRNTIDAVSKSGGTFTGDVTVDKNRTGTNLGISVLTLGNDIPDGTAGNSYGVVRLYGKTNQYTNLTAGNSTATRGISLPDESGTLMTDQGGTFAKPVAIDEHNGTASSVGASHLTLGNSIASGTAGNSTASLTMYGRQSYYTALYTAETLTSNRSIYFPDAGGTVALEEQIGSNANGSYVKFPGGLLIQWGAKTGLSFSNQTILEGTITLPVAFKDTNYVVVGNGSSSSNNSYVMRLGLNPSNTTTFGWTLASGSGSAITINNRGFYWIAIGRWK